MEAIREICNADINPLTSLVSHDEAAKKWGQKDFEQAINDDNQLCYIIDNSGFILIQKVLDEAEIIMIWITPDKRGARLGQELLGYAINELKSKGIKTMFLEVADNNQNAIKLYQTAGFIEIGRRKDYYKTANNYLIDAIVMNLNC